MNWHQQTEDEIFKELKTSEKGLSEQEVAERLKQYGKNELVAAKRKTVLQLFFKQFKDVMIVVLLVAAALSFSLKEYTDTAVILIIILLNSIIGFIQEFKAEKAMDLLNVMANPQSQVVRGGVTCKISSTDLVPGDVVFVEAGTKIPADIRLTEVHSLKIDESSLTGESLPVDKISTVLSEGNRIIGDYYNMAFKGTYVTYGRGKGIVTSTGMKTELGRIAEMLQVETPPTPLQLKMRDFSKKLTLVIVTLSALLFSVGVFKGNSVTEMFMLSLAVAVAAIPEALPAIITVSLALGARNLVKHNALIRRLYAVETLGSVSYICTDKTGTLTQNKMEVSEIWVPENEDDDLTFLQALHLNHDVINKGNSLYGDPTEVAMLLYLHQQKKYDIEWVKTHKRVDEIPFDSTRKVMTTIHSHNNGHLVVTKGAAESILAICKDIPRPEELNRNMESMAGRGLRVLAYAYSLVDDLPSKISSESIEHGMRFLGLAGLMDPPRAEAKQAINECKSAGIVPVMITGDHLATASFIARQLGILSEGASSITGLQLEEMQQKDLEKKVENIRVYARVSPEQKLRIITALQKRNHFVAMTGDGVNDAPSIKMANIGIAMGITGTDVTKESAQMILLDDNFATIVNAVKHGRRIYENIRKFIFYIMAGNAAELFSILIAPVIGLPLPLLPVQILWINLVSDGLPALALIAEPAEHDIMSKPPRKTDEHIFAHNLGRNIFIVGSFIGALTIASQVFLINEGVKNWQTMVFTILCFSQLWHVLVIRCAKEPVISKGLFRNPYVIGAVLFTVMLQLLIIYVPDLRVFFHTGKLSGMEILLTVAISSLVFWVQIAIKIFRQHSV